MSRHSEEGPAPGPLAPLEAIEGYRRLFMDAGLWRPYVRAICRRHGQTAGREIRPGLAGTFPTFVVDGRRVVKLFGRQFDGAQAFAAELQANQLLAGSSIPAPALLAHGRLFEATADWPWPYLVFEYVPAPSFGEVYGQVSQAERLALARHLGHLTSRLHRLPLGSAPAFQPSWDAYSSLLREQRARCRASHEEWGALPRRLIEQLDAFLRPPDDLADRAGPALFIHADITRDHVLGRLEDGHWTTCALIDYGDAMVGDLYYELVALHLDLFACDKRLLRAYLDAYGLAGPFRRLLPAAAMSTTLLHRFDVLASMFASHPRAREAASLDELAALLWDLDAPGLGG